MKIFKYVLIMMLVVLVGYLTFFTSYGYLTEFSVDSMKIILINPIMKIIGALLILGIIYFIYNIINKYANKHYFKSLVTILLVTLILKLIWITNFPLIKYYDIGDMIRRVSHFLCGDYVGFGYGGYLYTQPHLTGNTMFLYQVSKIFIHPTTSDYTNYLVDVARVGHAINIIFLTVSQFLVTKITLLITDSKEKSLLSGFAFMIFIPLIAASGYVYGDVTAMALLLLSVLFVIKYTKNQKIYYLFLSIITLGVSDLFRKLALVFLIAIVLYILIYERKYIILLFVPLFFLPTSLFEYTLIKKGFTEELYDNSVPVYSFIQIGLQYGTDKNTPGYYSGDVHKHYIETFNLDKEAATEFYKNNVIDLLKRRTLAHHFTFFLRKYVIHWGDGAFEYDLQNGMREINDITTMAYETPLQKITRGKFLGRRLVDYSHNLWYLIVATILFGLIKGKNNIKELNMIYLPILGIMAFYLIWEISPHYCLIVLPLFIILFAVYLPDLFDLINKNPK